MSRTGIAVRLVAAMLGAIAGTAGCALLGRAAVHTARGQRLDQLVLTAAQHDTSLLSDVVFPVLNTVTVPVIVIALVIAGIVALAQRRTTMVVQILVLVAGAAATTQILKHVVVSRAALADGIEITPNSFPSGHTTIAAAVAVALTLASPRHLRGAVAVASAAWTAIAGIGTIAGGWHRPSDVLGGLLVVAAWSSFVLGIDALLALYRTRPAARGPEGEADSSRRSRAPLQGLRGGRVAGPVLSALGVIGIAAGAAALLRVPTPLDLDDAAAQALAYTGTVLAVSGAVCLLLAWVLLLHVPVTRGRPGPPEPPGSAGSVRVR